MQLNVDNQAGNLLVSISSRTTLGTLKLGETAVDELDVYLCDPPPNAASPPVPVELPAGFSDIIVAGRPADDLEPLANIQSITMGGGVATIVTDVQHYLGTGDNAVITGVTAAGDTGVNGTDVVTYLSPYSFSVAIGVTANGGVGGTVQRGLLFSATGFTLVAGSTPYYTTADFNLNTAALIEALQGETSLPVAVDVDIESADATLRRRLVMQWNGSVYRAFYRGTESPPASGNPAYPTPAMILTQGVDTANIKRGVIAVANNAGSQAVAFTTNFAAAPTTVLAQLMVPNGGAIIECAVDYSTITTAGCTVVFGANTPNGNYKLQWLALV